MLEHPLGDVAGDVHNGLVARLSGFGQAGDERVTVVVPATLDTGLLPNLSPDRLETGARLGWIGGLGLAGGKDKPLGLEVLEFLQVPRRIRLQDFLSQRVERDGSTASGVGLGFPDDEVSLGKMHAAPLKFPKLLVAQPTVEHQD